MRYELFIGLRYTRSRKRGGGRNGFISFIAMLSTLGIALGVAALIVVLAVMNGFQREIRDRILGAASHIQVTAAEGDLADWQRVAQEAKKNPLVQASAPYVSAQGMLSLHDVVRGSLVRGVVPEQEDQVADFKKYMRVGSLQDLKPGEFGIILGAELARNLQVMPGEKITLISPQGLVTPAAILPRLKQFKLVGVFEMGHYEFDSALALVHMEDAQKLYRMGDQVSGVRLKLTDLFQAPQVGQALATSLGKEVAVTDWTRSHANFFRAVQIEKNVMFIILLLIVAVAAFNIVSTLVMAVTDKQADIAILRTQGASPGAIMLIFMVQGALIGLIGLTVGVVGGVALALNVDVVVPFLERLFGFQVLAKDVYYISELPSELHWGDVAVTTLVSFLLTVLATLYPSWRASRTQPAEALRYE